MSGNFQLNASRKERFEVFLNRLGQAPLSANFTEAYELLCSTMTAVEDEMTSIPNIPANWQTDKRLYPPQMDNALPVPGHPGVTCFRSKGHRSYIGANGALEIVTHRGAEVVLQKPGSDGRYLNINDADKT